MGRRKILFLAKRGEKNGIKIENFQEEIECAGKSNHSGCEGVGDNKCCIVYGLIVIQMTIISMKMVKMR